MTTVTDVDELLAALLPDEISVDRIPGDLAGGMGDRFRVKTVGPWHIEVVPQIVNWRVHTVRADTGNEFEWSHRHWCYEGRHLGSLVMAIVAAHWWDGAEDTEPVGWIRSWDMRRRGEGPCRPRPWRG